MAVGVVCASLSAFAATLPNELSTDAPLTVAVRGAVGPYYRPGMWTVLRVTVENRGEPFEAAVRVRETRGGRATYFVGAARAVVRRGTNSFDVLCAPGGAAAGTALEIARLDGKRRPGGAKGGEGGEGEGADEGHEVVYRGDLWRVLQPLGANDRLALGAGLVSFPVFDEPPLPPRPRAAGPRGVRFITSLIEPPELPRRAEAYAPVDIVVLEAAARGDVASAQTGALGAYLTGGGPVVMASFRALPALGFALSDLKDVAHRKVTGEREWPDRMPDRNVYPVGLSRLHVFAAEAGDSAAWKSPGAVRRFLAPKVSTRRPDPWIDAAAFEALAPERPFALAASRGRTVAIMSALLVTVAVALLARRRNRMAAAAALAATGVAWAVTALIVWREPVGAARIVRVRAMSADGRAELVVDTAFLVAFSGVRDFAFETETGPPLPVARREGEATASAFTLEPPYKPGGARTGPPRRVASLEEPDATRWRISSLSASPGRPVLVRAVTVRAPGEEGERLRERVLVDGRHVRVTELSPGRRRLEPVGHDAAGRVELPPEVRYLLERFAPISPLSALGPLSARAPSSREGSPLPAGEVAWVWIEGPPEGAEAPGLDPVADGSGTLVVAAVRSRAPRQHRGNEATEMVAE